jgi:hypothetical protein
MIFLFSMLFFMLAMVLMSVGVILNGRRIQGSCGGLSAIPGIESDCGGACHVDPERPESKCHRRSKSCANQSRQACRHHSEAGPKAAGAVSRTEEPS